MMWGKINHLKIYLLNPDDEALLFRIVSDMEKSFSKIANISVWRWEPEGHLFFRIFQFSQVFIKILVSLVSIVSLIILFFGIQNAFYLILNERSNEISVFNNIWYAVFQNI